MSCLELGQKRRSPMNIEPDLSFPQPPRRQGMAIASLIIGLAGTLTCGLIGIGAIAGIVLGLIAVSRATKNPAIYGGKGLAIAGIVVSAISPFPGLAAAMAVPNLVKSQQAAHETAAIETVKKIGRAQALYSVTTGRGRYGDFAALADSNCIERSLATGEYAGYVFTTTPVNIIGIRPMFDTTARPLTTGRFGTGNRSFASNETYLVYVANGSVQLKGTPDDREPH